MPKALLSGQFVRTSVCPEGKNKVDYYDTRISGFILEVRKSGGRTYYLRYRDEHGKLRQFKIGDANTLSFDKASNQALTMKAKVMIGEDPSTQRKLKRATPTLAQFSHDRYIPFIKSYKKTWDCDESLLRHHILPDMGHLTMDKITQEHIAEFQHGLIKGGYAAATANRTLVVIRYIYNLAIKWEIPGIKNNPVTGIKFLNTVSRERFLTPEETQRLYKSVSESENKQLKYIVPLLLLLGCRRSELFKAKWEDVDFERRLWRIPMSKSGRTRHVPLSLSAIEILKEVPRFEGCPYVLPNPETLKPFRDIFQSWDTARKRAGLSEVRLHDLRHSMASNLVNSGRTIYEVAKILGHTQIQTTQRYAHLSQETLLAAVDAAAKATGTNWEK